MVGGYAWAIYFYPDRKNMDDNGTYLSLFITLVSEGTDVRALFKLMLMDQSGKNAHMVHSHFGRAMDGGPYTLKYRESMWCEAMSTYPRTYDLLHANSVFSLYQDRCEMEDILLEMDKILRPEGTVIFRDDVDILLKIKSITDAFQWESRIVDHEDSPHNREKLLVAVKLYWTAPAPAPAPADEPQTES